MYSIIPFFGCQYKSILSGLMSLFCNPTIKNISYLILSILKEWLFNTLGESHENLVGNVQDNVNLPQALKKTLP